MIRALLILGGTVVSNTTASNYRTKGTFSVYIEKLCQDFDVCFWVVPIDNTVSFSGVISEKNIKVISYNSNIFGLLKAWISIALILIRYKVKTIIFHSVLLLPVMPLVRRKSEKSMCYLGVDYQKPIKLRRLRNFPGWHWFYRSGFEYPLKHSDLVIARGRSLKELALSLNENVVETAPMGWPPMKNNSSMVSQKYQPPWRVLFIGKTTKEKGLPELLDAVDRVSTKKDIVVDIIGSSGDIDLWKNYASSSKFIVFHGWIDDRSKIETFFSRANLLVCPSTYPEGVPRVIDEALVRNVPVIASNIGGISHEFDGTQVRLVEPGNVAELAKAIDAILEDLSYQGDTADWSKERVKRWGGFYTAHSQHSHLIQDIK